MTTDLSIIDAVVGHGYYYPSTLSSLFNTGTISSIITVAASSTASVVTGTASSSSTSTNTATPVVASPFEGPHLSSSSSSSSIAYNANDQSSIQASADQAVALLLYWIAHLPGVAHLASLFNVLYYRLFVRPLAYFYFGGPKLHGWGMWGGEPMHEICSVILSPPASLWLSGTAREVCISAIRRNFESFLITIQFVVYLYILFHVIKSILHWVGSPRQWFLRLGHCVWWLANLLVLAVFRPTPPNDDRHISSSVG